MIKNVAEFIKQIHGWNFPIDLDIICRNLSIKVDRKDLPAYLKGYYDQEKHLIVINSLLDKYNSRLQIAMEIRQAQFKEILRQSEKEKFGIELLMPTSEFLSVWNSAAPAQVMECSLYFDVSPNMVISRVKNLQKKRFLSPRVIRNFSDIQ
jgi:Zn-dependent peptidase ImmA (M78 family)